MENKEIKVTVCVMTFNQRKYIEKCLQSIVDQKVDFPFEIIVSDDCSVDGTAEIVSQFATRYPDLVKPKLLKRNIGAFKNFISLHDQAVGEYVAHLDGDDYWLPGKLQYQVEVLEKNPGASQCWTCAELVDDDGVHVGVFPSRLARMLNPIKISSKDIALSYALVGHHSTQMYRRSARQKDLLVEECLDYWVAFINSLSGYGIYSKKIMSAYRMGAIESITRTKNPKKSAVDVLSKHLLDLSRMYPSYANEAKANILVRRTFSALRGHDLTEIDSHLVKMIDLPAKPILMAKSFLFFALQKIG